MDNKTEVSTQNYVSKSKLNEVNDVTKDRHLVYFLFS